MSNTEATEIIQVEGEDGEEALVIETRMREIPNRRFSGRGLWRGRPVFYKVFVAGDRSTRHAARERAGAAALAERGIPGTVILHEGRASSPTLPPKSIAVLSDWVEDAENLDLLLRSSPSETRALSLLRELVRLVAHHHVSGIVQRDLHFANFALVGEIIHTFDPGSIEARKGPVSRGAAFDNLAIFFAQVDPGWDSAIPMLLDAYVEIAGAEMRPELDRLWRRLVKERHKRMQKFLDKVLRPCRLTEIMESGKSKILISRPADDAELRDLVDTIVAMPEPSDGLGLPWRGETIRLRVFDAKARRTPTSGPARRAWRNSQRLRLEGLTCPEPLASGPGWFLAAQPCGSSLESLVAETEGALEPLADDAAQLLQRLDQLGLVHGRPSRRMFVRLADGRLGLTDLEELDEGPSRAFGAPATTSADMIAGLDCWRSTRLHEPLLTALQSRGYALDLL